MIRYTYALFPLVLACMAFSCTEMRSTNEDKKHIEHNALVNTKTVEVKRDTASADKKTRNYFYFNEISALLGGVMDSGGVLNHLYDSAAWEENAKFINTSWKKLETNRLAKLAKWSSHELTDANHNCKTVFYPFSGPDFLTANAFFPNAEKLVMLGLEPIGSLPPIYEYSNEEANDYCNDFKKSLTDIFEKSYFITSYMLRDFQKQKVNGLLPVLCFFIKKTGHDIMDINYLVRHNNDSISEAGYNTKKNFFGVKITFKKNNLLKTAYYFRYDVSNKQFNDTCIFYKFINNNTKNMVTYIKSASYLLHANFMSNIKKLILRNSNYVLEDDTGIPYDDIYKTNQYSIKLYGRYIKPVKDFPYLRMQTGIVKAFEKDSASIPDLPFHLGYHWQSKRDLLIYASKKRIQKN